MLLTKWQRPALHKAGINLLPYLYYLQFFGCWKFKCYNPIHLVFYLLTQSLPLKTLDIIFIGKKLPYKRKRSKTHIPSHGTSIQYTSFKSCMAIWHMTIENLIELFVGNRVKLKPITTRKVFKKMLCWSYSALKIILNIWNCNLFLKLYKKTATFHESAANYRSPKDKILN